MDSALPFCKYVSSRICLSDLKFKKKYDPGTALAFPGILFLAFKICSGMKKGKTSNVTFVLKASPSKVILKHMLLLPSTVHEDGTYCTILTKKYLFQDKVLEAIFEHFLKNDMVFRSGARTG